MIIDAILGLLMGLVRAVVGLLPAVSWPAWVTGSGSGTVRGSVTAMAGAMSGFGTWIPLDVFISVMQSLAAVVAVALVVRAVRFAISIVTMGGGN